MARLAEALLRVGLLEVGSSFMLSGCSSWASRCDAVVAGWAGGRTGPEKTEGLFDPSGGLVEGVRNCSWT